MVIFLRNEGNKLSIERAGLVRRAVAFYIDAFIVTMLVFIPMYRSITQIETNADFISAVNNSILYSIIALVILAIKDCFKGTSLGKWMLGIRVVDVESGKIPSVSKSIVRNIFIVIWPVEFFALLFSKDKRRIGDKIANTIVVRERNKSSIKRVLIIILTVIIFLSSFIFLIGSLLKSDQSYQTAIEYIERNEDLLNVTKGIKGYGLMPMGSIEVTNGYGQAGLTISVKGNEKDVKVYIYLEKKPGSDWIVKGFEFDPKQ